MTVNGEVAHLGEQADPQQDAVRLDGRRVRLPAIHRYLLLNKPKGCLTTRSDPAGRATVFDLIPPHLARGLKTVGRLDYQSEGLLLLTDDGELAQIVAHPRYGCRKTYAVKVKGTPDDLQLDRLRQGIVIGGRRTAPAKITPLVGSDSRGRTPTGNSWWTVELQEGRTRQIREMFFRIGHPVRKLRRVAIGQLSDPRLPPGSYRELRAAEVERLRRPTGARRQRRRSGASRSQSRKKR